MSVKKSDLIKDLANNYPNFLKKDLAKLIDIVIDNIKNSLKNGERIELGDTFMFVAKKYKSKYARNPKTNEKLLIPEKKIVRFKISKKWQKLINEKK